MDKLLPYQVPHKLQLHESLIFRNRVLDASDTGTGKTYVAISECKDLGLRPFIICPKAVIPVWVDVCKYFGVSYLGISNYEMLKGCRYYTEDYEATKCPYMDKELIEDVIVKKNSNSDKSNKSKITNMSKNISKTNKLNAKTKKKDSPEVSESGSESDLEDEEEVMEGVKTSKNIKFVFYLPDDVIVIFDEAHRCKNLSSITSKLLLGLSQCKNKIMILSATITDKIACFKPFGIFFDFYKDPKQFKIWMNRQVKLNQHKYQKQKLNISGDLMKLDIIHNAVFPNYGSRMKIKELGDLFPQNRIIANCYYLENHIAVEKLYNEINDALVELALKEMRSEALGKLIFCRQKIEMLKVTIFMDLALEGLDSGFSVVIFVNYLDTMNYLCYHLKTEADKYGGIAIIAGGQGIEERQANIDDFQNNSKRLMIATIQAGGIGISLHDIHGDHPRLSIISPSWTATEVKQALGRVHRAGAKTPALQKIIYVAKTYEEDICALIKQKFIVMDAINDGDMTGPKIPKEVLEELEKPQKIDEFKTMKKNIDGVIEPEDLEEIIPIETRMKQIKKKKFKKSKLDETDF